MANDNLYDALGLSQSASQGDIKKAYRKLVRKYHPDVSKEADADAKMAQINQAYETLKDDDKRKSYDAYLQSPLAGKQPFDAAQDYSNINEQFANQYYRQATGSGFEGFGQEDGSFRFDDLFGAFNRTRGRHSQGRQTHNGFDGFAGFTDGAQSAHGEDQHAELTVDVAAAYSGAQRSLSLNVPLRKGNQVTFETKTLNVKIPKGIAEGQQIRLSGQGMPSPDPNKQGAKSGDLYLKIKFAETDVLHVQGKDVYQKVYIAPWEAALGGSIVVDTPAGKLGVNVPKRTQSGKRLRLKGKGIPAKIAGDLYLELVINIPEVSTSAQRDAWEQLADAFAEVEMAR